MLQLLPWSVFEKLPVFKTFMQFLHRARATCSSATQERGTAGLKQKLHEFPALVTMTGKFSNLIAYTPRAQKLEGKKTIWCLPSSNIS